MQPVSNPNSPREFYALTMEFDTTIAAGSSAQKYAQVDTSGNFFIQSMRATVWIPTAQTSIIMTPLANGSVPTAASNTFPCLSSMRLELAVAGVNWQSNPIRLNTLAGDAGNPFFFQTMPGLAQLSQLTGTLYNDNAAFTVQAQLVFFGYKEPR